MTELNWTELWDEDENRFRVQTRDGLKVRIWTLEARSNEMYPVRGEVRADAALNTWFTASWTKEGKQYTSSEQSYLDLVPELRTVMRWVNVYRKGKRYQAGEVFHPSESVAKEFICLFEGRTHVATVPVEWKE